MLSACGAPASNPEPDATYYLVRHAEKTKDKKDPALTEEGTKRAQDLALRLKGVPLTKIYTSNYKRTRNTAAPITAATNLEFILYNPGNLDRFAKELLMETGHILVLGHSNTTPKLSAFLGGESGEPIVEATEYDRLYILQRRGENVVTTIERYGEKS